MRAIELVLPDKYLIQVKNDLNEWPTAQTRYDITNAITFAEHYMMTHPARKVRIVIQEQIVLFTNEEENEEA